VILRPSSDASYLAALLDAGKCIYRTYLKFNEVPWTHAPTSWTRSVNRRPIPPIFQSKNNSENSPALVILQKHPNFFEIML
jgi:hypothetical protein